ncbi:MAG: NAD(P)-dependent alcohol dehydrogenase [Acidimicrobiales bacterium]
MSNTDQLPPTTATPQPHHAGLQMQAITQDRYGSHEVLELGLVDRPSPGPEEVLIEVEAAGIDRGTCHLMTGTPYLIRLAGFGLTRPKNKIPGLDVAGRVTAIGEDVSRFAVGDEVFGIANGSLAEYALAHQDKLANKPANLSFEQAAVAAVSGITALQALTDIGKIQEGQRLLIIGASGGVGSFAVQLAKVFGAEVTGVASTPNLELVRSLGADHVVDYTQDDFAGGNDRYDLILDIGGRNSLSRLRSVLAPTGALIIVGGEDGNRITGGVGRQLRAMMLSPLVGQRLTTFISKEHYSFIERLAGHMEAGEVVPAIEGRFSLDQTAQAVEQLNAGRARGKSVIVIDPDTGDAG